VFIAGAQPKERLCQSPAQTEVAASLFLCPSDRFPDCNQRYESKAAKCKHKADPSFRRSSRGASPPPAGPPNPRVSKGEG
jgi:hypothetical protein